MTRKWTEIVEIINTRLNITSMIGFSMENLLALLRVWLISVQGSSDTSLDFLDDISIRNYVHLN